MNTNWRLAEELTPADVREHPVWEYVMDDPEASDTVVRPVETLPVSDLGGRLVGVRVKLANGCRCWAILSNISLRNPVATKHFLCIRVEKNRCWFELGRYHDVDSERRSPTQLGEFLGLPVSDVFPIEYDIADVAVGEMSVLRGKVPQLPTEQLTEDELVELALRADDCPG